MREIKTLWHRGTLDNAIKVTLHFPRRRKVGTSSKTNSLGKLRKNFVSCIAAIITPLFFFTSPTYIITQVCKLCLVMIYRVTVHNGEKTFRGLSSNRSDNWWAAIVATYCQGRMMEHPKSKSTGGLFRCEWSPCTSYI